MKIRTTVFLSCLLFLSCGKVRSGSTGPCDHIYEDPVIHIDSVTDVQNGNLIFAFQILEVWRNGYREQPWYLRIVSYNVVEYDTMLICNLRCGFGNDEGLYTLKVSTLGYRDTTVSVNAKYAVFKPGCPSSNSGGTIFNFKMQKQ